MRFARHILIQALNTFWWSISFLNSPIQSLQGRPCFASVRNISDEDKRVWGYLPNKLRGINEKLI